MGLAPYDERDHEAFFGRDAEVRACVERLHSTRLLVVAGPSGCGKSSLVRAGLVPALRRRGTDLVIVTPGADPAAALSEALNTGDRSTWVVDQFEELFTLGASQETVRDFCRALVKHVGDGATVIAVVRSDQLGGISVAPELIDLAESGLHFVSTLSGPALREAIEEPARMAGLRLEHGLVDLLVRDCEGEPGALPLLSHALAETWRRRDGHTLTVEGYESSGGIRVAVARSADRLYDSLPAEQRDTLRSILLRLVTPTLDGEPVRCRVPSRSILGEPGRDRVVGLLVRARLVTSEKETFEIAHEALARAWPRLRAWLDDDVAGQRILRHLVSAADGWDSLGRPATELYRGARLETALEWRDHATTELTELETSFLEASAELADSERRELAARAERESRNNRRLRGLLAALAVLLVGALIVGAVAVRASRQADRASRVASARELAAAADASIDIDPERGVLLGLAAVARARPVGGAVLSQAEEALHRAVSATQIQWRAVGTGGAVDWSPDGQRVVTEGPEGSGTVDVRDAELGSTVLSLTGHDDVTDVVYSEDGTRLGTTGLDGTVRIWDATTGRELWRVGGQSGAGAWAPSFSPAGSLIAAAWPDEDGGLVRIVEASTGRVVLESRSVPGAGAVSWSPDGRRLAVASAVGPDAVVIDAGTGDELFPLDEQFYPLSDIEWSPDGGSIAVAGDGASAHVYDAASGALRFAVPGHGAPVGAASWSPDSQRLATASADGTTKIWMVTEGGGRLLTTLTAADMRSGFDDVDFSADGRRLITGSRSGVTAAWDVGLSAGSETATLPAAAFFYNAAQFDQRGGHLYTTSAGGQVSMWDTDTWERVRVLGRPPETAPPPSAIDEVPMGSIQDVMRIAPSPDGALVASVSDASTIGLGPDGRVRVHDTRSGAEVLDLVVGTWAKDADWSPDGEVLALAGGDQRGALVRLVDRSGSAVGELRFGEGELVGAARFSHDGASIIVEIEPSVGRYDPDVGRVEVWDWRNAERELTIPADGWFAVPSPVDDIVAIAPHERAGDEEMAVWDTRTGEKVATLAGQTGGVNHLAFSADGARLAVASGDGTTRIWDPMTGDLLLTLGGHLGLMSAVSFSPDGTQLATTGADGRVRIWALDLDTLVEIAEQRVTRSLTDEECRRYLDAPCPTPWTAASTPDPATLGAVVPKFA